MKNIDPFDEYSGRKATKIVIRPVADFGWRVAACVLITAMAACTTPQPPLKVLTSNPSGARLSLLPAGRSQVLVVKSKEGFGRARLQIGGVLPEGMTVEFPALKNLEQFSLRHEGKDFVCIASAEPEAACRWGSEWPVGSVRRYPGGMTVNVPARVLAPGKWDMQWVDYWRH